MWCESKSRPRTSTDSLTSAAPACIQGVPKMLVQEDAHDALNVHQGALHISGWTLPVVILSLHDCENWHLLKLCFWQRGFLRVSPVLMSFLFEPICTRCPFVISCWLMTILSSTSSSSDIWYYLPPIPNVICLCFNHCKIVLQLLLGFHNRKTM